MMMMMIHSDPTVSLL